jgi:hypothetical protein
MKKGVIITSGIFLLLLLAPSFSQESGLTARGSSSRDIIEDITINMFGSQYAEEDFQLIMDAHNIPLDWVLYGAFPYTAADIELIKNNIQETHARGLKYLHHIPIERMYFDGEQSLGDLKPELSKYAIKNIDGEKFVSEFDGIGVYNMCLSERGWQKFLKSEIRHAVDAGADGILLDEIQAHTLYIGFESGGVFNTPDMKGFRKFLKKVYSKQFLSTRFGIDNIDGFDYQKYILQNGYRSTWLSAPWEVPLFNEFRTYEIQAALKVEKKIIRWAKKYAKSKYKRDIVFMGNTSDGLSFSVPFEENLDAAWLEYPYLHYGYPPLSKIIPSSKLRVDDRWKKGTYITQVPTNADLIARGSPPNIVRVFWAEAYAANCECNVPFMVPGSSTEGYSPDLTPLSPYFRFIDTYREYYGGDWSWTPKVALFYSVCAYMGIPDSFMGTSLALFEGGIQYDVLFSGDDTIMKNNLTLEKMQQYPVILMANTGSMSHKQVKLVMDYVSRGGTVIAWGGVGIDDPFGNNMVDDFPPDWVNFWFEGNHRYGKGRFINIENTDELGAIYFKKRKPANRNRILNAVTPYAPPEITSTAPENINFLIYTDSSNNKLALHMINYRYDLKKDSIKAAKNFFVTLSLPDGYIMTGKKATLYSPDLANPKKVKIQKINNMTIKLKIPRLDYYNLLVIE